MRAFLGLFIVAAVSAVSGSYLLSPRQSSPYPQCALDCLAVADLGSCLVGEVECLCKNNAFIVSTTQCFEAKCTASELATSENIAQQSCAAAVCVTLTSSIPPATSTSPTTKPSSTSSSSTPSASASTSSNSNSAASNAVNIVGGVAALGLTALML
ncbi:hypothetical protein EDB85DRAFT_1946680 [Lactarius pseudohatsudake]|nr:hypothetical protein EDB85DRAFT_1946680 [Lactarius pseudohatsudake]